MSPPLRPPKRRKRRRRSNGSGVVVEASHHPGSDVGIGVVSRPQLLLLLPPSTRAAQQSKVASRKNAQVGTSRQIPPQPGPGSAGRHSHGDAGGHQDGSAEANRATRPADFQLRSEERRVG